MGQLTFDKSPKNPNPGCADLMAMAEQELSAFFWAVTELFGSEQADISAEDWLNDLKLIESLPESAREWRSFTARASARLATRTNLSSQATTIDEKASSVQTQQRRGWHPMQQAFISDLKHVGKIVQDEAVITALSEGVRAYPLDPNNTEALWKKSEELVGESF